MSWEKLNKLLEWLKNSPSLRLIYKLPGAPSLYHFLLALLGGVIYSFPGSNIFVIGVTGTKGKTTTIELLNAILEAAGKRTAVLSSLRIKIAGESKKNPLGNTLPGRFFTQNFLKNAVKEKCQYALIEVTSQGVLLSRHRFINWNAGVLTNLAPEHIEAHGSFENYREAKLKFLRYVIKKGGKVFINGDDRNSPFFMGALKNSPVLMFSKSDEGVLRILPKISPARAAAGSGPPAFFLSGFNQDNIAAAVAVVKDLGIGELVIEDALRRFSGVPGRMEFIEKGGITAVVDYAHTPDSLEAAHRSLKYYLKEHRGKGRLICVFGAAGGGRDKWKRPKMGEIASKYCDQIILTDEDPYDESSAEILAQIKSGIPKNFPQTAVCEILDRREAIKKAVSLAGDGDVIVVTGKGSEDWIHLGRGKKIPWDEKEVVGEILCR